GQRKLLGGGAHVGDPATASIGLRDLRVGRIDADGLYAHGGGAPRHLPFAAPDVKHAARTSKVSLHERKDLLLVLRVRAVGELFLPPARTALPQRGVAHTTILATLA